MWRNELADAFVEMIAAPWFARPTTGTWMLNVWLRSLGARVGRGVWCETYWLPEADLIELRDGVTVNRGCVVQTHLFHDRMMSMDVVSLRAGSTLGPNSVILPAAVLGKHATVGPVSLVMRGESVPSKTRWIGNPIGPWAPTRPTAAPVEPAQRRGGRRLRPRSRRPPLRRAVLRADPALRRGGQPPVGSGDPSLPRGEGHRPPRPRPAPAVGVEGDRRRRPARQVRPSRRSAGDPAAAPGLRRRRGHGGRRLRRPPGPCGRPARRRRLGGARGRRDRGLAAARRTLVVPVQRPAVRQGVVRRRAHRTHGVPRAVQRRSRRAASGREYDDLALRAVRADGDLSRDRADRALHRTPAGGRAGARGDRVPGRDPRPLRRPVRAAGRDDERVRPDVRRLPVRGAVPVGGDRGRPGDPARGAGTVDLRRQLPRGRLVDRAARRPRALPPVVRQQPDDPELARHLDARGFRLLQRVALVGGVGAGVGRRARPASTGSASTTCRRTCCSATRGPTTCSTTASTSAERCCCTPCG